MNDELQAVDEGELAAQPDQALNVAATYAALRDDIAGGTSTVVGFNHAVQLSQLVDDVIISAQTGRYTGSGEWPTA